MSIASITEIVLHLGAHRTGSTAIQAALRADDVMLRAQGIICLTPEGAGYRGRPTLRTTTKSIVAASSRRGLRRWWALRSTYAQLSTLIGPTAPHRLILSDENLLGPIFEKYTGRGIYPSPRSGLTTLASFIGRVPDRIVLTIRPYDSFIPSAYAMSAAYAKDLPTFEDLRDGLTHLQHGWPDLINTIRSCLPGARLDVFCVGRDDISTVRTALLGPIDGIALSPIPRTNITITQDALQAISDSQTEEKTTIDDLILRHADGAALDLLSPIERTRLRSMFDADIASLNLFQ